MNKKYTIADIQKLKKMDKMIDWGTDDEKLKGGDFFNAKESKS